jgi:hypothetical protein
MKDMVSFSSTIPLLLSVGPLLARSTDLRDGFGIFCEEACVFFFVYYCYGITSLAWRWGTGSLMDQTGQPYLRVMSYVLTFVFLY